MVDPNKRSISLIDVTPKTELVFNYVIKKTNISFIGIKNISVGVIAFKVKTNKPQSYLVKPHEGILTQDQSSEIEITMQPTDYNPQTSVLDDKFLIVAMLLPPKLNPTDIPALWKSTPIEEQEQVKLKVTLKVEGTSSTINRPSISKESTPTTDSSKLKTESKSSFDMTESTQGSLYKSTLPTIEERPNSPSEITNKNQVKTGELTKKSSPGPEKSIEERISQFERELTEVKAEKERLKIELEQSNTKRKSQEQFVFQLSEEKNKFENELNMLKTSTFKQRKDTGAESREGAKPIEIWHIVVVAVISLILGAFLSR